MNLPYNKKAIKTAALLSVFVVGLSFIVFDFYTKKQDKSTIAEQNVESYDAQKIDFSGQNEEKIVCKKSESEFLIKEYNGNVAVFENGKSFPFKTTETMVKDLPVADRELLKKGISVESKEELSRILEDYCS